MPPRAEIDGRLQPERRVRELAFVDEQAVLRVAGGDRFHDRVERHDDGVKSPMHKRSAKYALVINPGTAMVAPCNAAGSTERLATTIGP